MTQARAAAGALFCDDHARVLLVQPSYKPYRDIPGGYIEPGETPTQACAREVREELGISPSIGRLLVADWAPHPSEGDKILFVFDGGTLTADQRDEITLDPAELSGYDFHDADQLPDLLIDRLANRLRAALDAKQDGRTRYLEHGHEPSTLPN